MKRPIVALALFGICAGTATSVLAQSATSLRPGGNSLFQPLAPDPNMTPSSGGKVYSGNEQLPGPIAVDDIKPMTAELPNDPIEPYLLTKQNGPFMVLAKTFRGPDAERMALALCKELRQDFHLPAYVLRTKDFPMKSLIRGVPPTAPRDQMVAQVKLPEKVRTFDEAAVLVGDEKTTEATEKLLHDIKKLKPKCLDGMPVLFQLREGGGLHRATRTTNPYWPAQALFPRAKDKLLVKMNNGARSVTNCPGHFSLQVAQFSGRSAYNLNNQDSKSFLNSFSGKESPLEHAAVNAEKMAEKLARDPDIRRLGQPIYVYHDRTSSQVFIGSFESERDPAAAELHRQLILLAVPLMAKNRGTGSLDVMIVPATALTDVAQIKSLF